MRGWEWHLIRCTAPAKGFCQLRTADGKGSPISVITLKLTLHVNTRHYLYVLPLVPSRTQRGKNFVLEKKIVKYPFLDKISSC